MSDIVKAFNDLGRSQICYIKFNDLKIKKPYQITKCEAKITKYGRTIVVTLNERYNINLPNRYNKATNEQIKQIKGKYLVYYGCKNINGYDMHDIEFIDEQ